MEITEALKSLENSWSREDVLVKIKNGEDSEKIVNDFCNTKQQEIETISKFINPEDIILFTEIEKLSKIESKLMNKIKNYSFNKFDLLTKDIHQENKYESENKSLDFSSFMMKWSNKFVFISLLVITAIALTKQAWA